MNQLDLINDENARDLFTAYYFSQHLQQYNNYESDYVKHSLEDKLVDIVNRTMKVQNGLAGPSVLTYDNGGAHAVVIQQLNLDRESK